MVVPTVVRYRLLTPAQIPIPLRPVYAQLKSGDGFLLDHTGGVEQYITVQTDAQGWAELPLLPQMYYAESDTWYEVWSTDFKVYAQIPESNSPVLLLDCLVDPSTLTPIPPAVPSVYIPRIEKGSPLGVATLGADRVIPHDQLQHAPIILTYSPSIVTNVSLGNTFRMTLTGSPTIENPVGGYDGQRVLWEVIQDGVGSRVPVLGVKFNLGTTVVSWSTAPNKRDYLGAIYNSAKDLWDVFFSKGY